MSRNSNHAQTGVESFPLRSDRNLPVCWRCFPSVTIICFLLEKAVESLQQTLALLHHTLLADLQTEHLKTTGSIVLLGLIFIQSTTLVPLQLPVSPFHQSYLLFITARRSDLRICEVSGCIREQQERMVFSISISKYLGHM